MNDVLTFLTNPNNPRKLRVTYRGEKRTLFINDKEDISSIGILKKGCSRKGYCFSDFDGIEKIHYPNMEMLIKDNNEKLIEKYQRLASKASFISPFIKDIMKADPKKSLYENNLSTGTRIDGKLISLNAVEKWCGDYVIKSFKKAVQEKTDYYSMRFNFRGYDGSLWVTSIKDEEEIRAGLSVEYRGCGNGYYYQLINDDYFVGYDID